MANSLINIYWEGKDFLRIESQVISSTSFRRMTQVCLPSWKVSHLCWEVTGSLSSHWLLYGQLLWLVGQYFFLSFHQASQVVKNPLANAGDVRYVGLFPGLGRFPGGGHGNLLQNSCLENPMDRGAWWAAVHRVAKSQTQLSNFTHTHTTRFAGTEIGQPTRYPPVSM